MNLATRAAAAVASAGQFIKSQGKQIVGKSVKRQPQPPFAHSLQTRSVCVCECVYDLLFTLVVRFAIHTHVHNNCNTMNFCLPASPGNTLCLCLYNICVLLVAGRTMPKVYILVCVSVCACHIAGDNKNTHTHIELLTPTQRVVDKLGQTRAKKH